MWMWRESAISLHGWRTNFVINTLKNLIRHHNPGLQVNVCLNSLIGWSALTTPTLSLHATIHASPWGSMSGTLSFACSHTPVSPNFPDNRQTPVWCNGQLLYRSPTNLFESDRTSGSGTQHFGVRYQTIWRPHQHLFLHRRRSGRGEDRYS